jgi:hypothetical protein
LSHSLHYGQQQTPHFGDYYAFTAHQMWARRPKILLHRLLQGRNSVVSSDDVNGRPGIRKSACGKYHPTECVPQFLTLR